MARRVYFFGATVNLSSPTSVSLDSCWPREHALPTLRRRARSFRVLLCTAALLGQHCGCEPRHAREGVSAWVSERGVHHRASVDSSPCLAPQFSPPEKLCCVCHLPPPSSWPHLCKFGLLCFEAPPGLAARPQRWPATGVSARPPVLSSGRSPRRCDEVSALVPPATPPTIQHAHAQIQALATGHGLSTRPCRGYAEPFNKPMSAIPHQQPRARP